MSIKVFKRAPNCTADLVQSKKKFIGKLKSVLLEESFYSGNNFFMTTVECYGKLNVYDKYTIHNYIIYILNNILQIIYSILKNQFIKSSDTDL
jgi:tellurite resistance protein TehA-like permease